MKKLLFALSLLTMTLTATAMPAKRGIWKTLRLADGTEVRAQLTGDEHGHYWLAADGYAYRKVSGETTYQEVDAAAVMAKAKARRSQADSRRAKRLQRRRMGSAASYTGKKKGIIILVNYADKAFKSTNNKALYERIANEENFSQSPFKGSMADYFKAQSGGLFELDFDVVGPVTISKGYKYYGANGTDDEDLHPGEMVIEAVNLAKAEVTDWTPYDWDGDGEVDQVYVVYAGYGEADYDDDNVIWPHAYDLASAQSEMNDGTGPVEVGPGLYVNTYACGGELNGYGWNAGKVAGIGTMCHEFSHCLGYPDFYDIDYSGGQGMCSWDLMDNGSYNGDGYQPAGYTSYERWVAGWMEPVVLEAEDVTVEGMKSLQAGGESYIIYNQGNRNEYFLLENRQLDGWDAGLPGAGLLIVHADYDERVWQQNEPNDDPKHQRMTWIPADKKYQSKSDMGYTYYDVTGIENDPFPYGNTKSFNKDFGTLAKFYNKNTNGTYYMGSSVEDISMSNDGTVSFKFVADYSGSIGGTGDDPVKPTIEGALFYESFDQCSGKGGNDDLWKGNVASAALEPDNEGWTAEKGWGANQCAKFGTGSVTGAATTPAFAMTGTGTLTFRAGAWDANNDGTTLNLSVSEGTVSPASVTMQKGAFTDFTVTITATGNVKLTFEAEKGRFFLDEVLVKEPGNTDAIQTLSPADGAPKAKGYYTLDGRSAGNDLNLLRRGIYIVGGHKVVIK